MSKIIKVTEENIIYTSRIVEKGGVIVYPTDTVYGLGCDPFNEDAVRKLIEVKAREEKPLPVLSSNLTNAKRIAFFTEMESKLARRLWPGALTIVLKKKDTLPSIVTLGLDKVGIRVPDLQITRKLIRLCGGLLIGTSANISGRPSSKTAIEAAQQLGNKVDVILDFGPTKSYESSTVVEIVNLKPMILREGSITLTKILETINSGE